MRKPDSLQGSLDLLVLKILSRRPRLHGYAIMSAIKDMPRRRAPRRGRLALSGAAPHGGSRLDSRRNGSPRTPDGGRGVYQLTAAGKKQLAAEESRWQAVTSAVNRVLRTV